MKKLLPLLITTFFISFLTSAHAIAQDVDSLNVMSFNIRFGTANDGDNHWKHRKEYVFKTIADYGPDLLGMQEVLPLQVEFLRKKLPEYSYVGRSRQTTPNGEQCGIMIKSARFDILEEGHFWLSETPNVPGSKSWDSSLPRMASWVKLFDRSKAQAIYFVNTHFDHRGQNARLKSAQVIVDRVQQFEVGIPIVLAGDFNASENSAPIKLLRKRLVDTFEKLHPNATNQSTSSGFRGKIDGNRIDYVFASENWIVDAAAIDRRSFNGKYPSDHYPVTCTLKAADK